MKRFYLVYDYNFALKIIVTYLHYEQRTSWVAANKRWRRSKGHWQHCIHKTLRAKTNKAQKHKKNPHKTKKMSNKDPQKTRGEPIIMLAKSKQFLLLIRHPPCYSYILSRPTVNLLGDRGKKLHKKEMIHCHFRYGYFVTVNL